LEKAKGSVSASSVRRVRLSGAPEKRSASDTGSVSVARARIARQRVMLKDELCAYGYVGIVSDVTSSARREAAARLATHAPAFTDAVAECSGVR
jgi:hypothetical protein